MHENMHQVALQLKSFVLIKILNYRLKTCHLSCKSFLQVDAYQLYEHMYCTFTCVGSACFGMHYHQPEETLWKMPTMSSDYRRQVTCWTPTVEANKIKFYISRQLPTWCMPRVQCLSLIHIQMCIRDSSALLSRNKILLDNRVLETVAINI